MPVTYEWVVRLLPKRRGWKIRKDLKRLSKKSLVEHAWACQVTSDEALECASEAWARCWELREMVEGKRPIDQDLLDKLRQHELHVVACKLGSCEHEFAALLRAGHTGEVNSGSVKP